MKKSALELYVDGGARGNPGPSAYAVIIIDADEEMELVRETRFLGQGTNNEAEYEGLIAGLDLCRQFAPNIVFAHSDSQLVIQQMLNNWKIKEPRLQKLFNRAISSESNLKQVNYKHVPRTHNLIQKADELVNQCLDNNIIRRPDLCPDKGSLKFL